MIKKKSKIICKKRGYHNWDKNHIDWDGMDDLHKLALFVECIDCGATMHLEGKWQKRGELKMAKNKAKTIWMSKSNMIAVIDEENFDKIPHKWKSSYFCLPLEQWDFNDTVTWNLNEIFEVVKGNSVTHAASTRYFSDAYKLAKALDADELRIPFEVGPIIFLCKDANNKTIYILLSPMKIEEGKQIEQKIKDNNNLLNV